MVMAIISLLLAAAFPIFTNNSNSARNASREIIKGYLQQARANAIASGNATALAIPTFDSDTDLGARAIFLLEVEKGSGDYVAIKEKDAAGTTLTHDSLLQRPGKLSGNFYFLSNQVNTPKPTILDEGAELTVTLKNKALSCRAIIFSPNGQIVRPASGTPAIIAIGQGTNRGGSFVLTDKSDGQPVFDLLQINRLTGRARFYQPE